MKTLLLLRHAKSEDISFLKPDFNRKITEKGRNDIKKVGQYYFAKYPYPDVVLSSSANRTKQTTEMLFDVKTNIIYLDELYQASASEILDSINKYAKMYNYIAIVGHNMGLSQLANILSKTGCEELATSGCAMIEFESEISIYQGVLKELIHPKTI